jgi:hypothetical protein
VVYFLEFESAKNIILYQFTPALVIYLLSSMKIKFQSLLFFVKFDIQL